MVITAEGVLAQELLLTKDECAELAYAKTMSIVYDEDYPETTPERALRFRRINPIQRLGGKEAKNLFSKCLDDE